jgi:SAM-dependent methyltransferase
MATNNNINAYHSDVEIRNFPLLEKELESYYDLFVKDEIVQNKVSPRGTYEYSIGFKEIFYYISWLYDNNPQSVLDIGSGECFWKRWFSNIITLDPGNYYSAKNADFPFEFSENFANDHFEEYDCGMAINSLHFGKLSLIEHHIHQAMRVIKPGGRFLFTLSTGMIQSFYLPKDILERNVPPEEYWVDMTKEVILKLPYKFVLFDCLFDRLGYDFPSLGHINGTIRFILEK